MSAKSGRRIPRGKVATGSSHAELFFSYMSNFGVFLFFALSLLVKSGYSYGAGLLLLVALCSCPWWIGKLHCKPIHYYFIVLLILVGTFGIFDAWRLGHGWGAYNRPIRYFLCIPLFLYLTVYPPRPIWLWWGIVLGASTAGLSALYYTYGGNPALTFFRASRYLNAIQFGNLSALLGVLCLCGLPFARRERRLFLWIMLPLGCLFGLIASLLSQSRGGWLALLIAVAVFLATTARRLNRQQWLGIITAALLGSMVLLTMGKHVIPHRLSMAERQVHAYIQQDNTHTSVGARLSMWAFGLQEGMRYPLLGPDRQTMLADKKAWVKQGNGHAVLLYGHLHNEYINSFASQGMLGLSILLLLFLFPLSVFRYNLAQDNAEPRLDFAWAGIYLIIMHMGFGLTQVSLNAHNSGFMLFVIPLCLFYALSLEEGAVTATHR